MSPTGAAGSNVPVPTITSEDAVRRAADLVSAAGGRRIVIGITGAPGAGKSTLAAAVAAAVPGGVAVPMDGYHLAHSVLTARGDVELKGAITTFDGDGYVSLLRRLRERGPETVWAPEFRREIEDAIAGALPVTPEAPLVVTEGNYLLADADPWRAIPDLCDEIWYVDPGEERRLEWLVARHVAFGRSDDVARARATTGSDGTNATFVSGTRARADVIVAPSSSTD